MKEDWRVQQPKHCEYNTQNEHADLNSKACNDNSSSQIFQYKSDFVY